MKHCANKPLLLGLALFLATALPSAGASAAFPGLAAQPGLGHSSSGVTLVQYDDNASRYIREELRRQRREERLRRKLDRIGGTRSDVYVDPRGYIHVPGIDAGPRGGTTVGTVLRPRPPQRTTLPGALPPGMTTLPPRRKGAPGDTHTAGKTQRGAKTPGTTTHPGGMTAPH